MTDKKDESGTVLFKKLGGGHLTLTLTGKKGKRNNRIIKPGQTFRAKPEEIPEAFKDLIVPVHAGELDAAEEATQKEVVKEKVTPEYELKHRGGGWYNVLDADGKQINDEALKKEAAEALISSLT